MEKNGIEYGPEIDVSAGRPEWLKDGEQVMCRWDDVEHGPYDPVYIVGFGDCLSAIRLPADHFAYAALDKGFIPWGGGEEAPGEIAEVMFREGCSVDTSDGGQGLRWAHNGGGDIIGYKRVTCKQEPDTVTVKRMTEDEWLSADRPFSLVWGKSVGLIREETLLQQFEREHCGPNDMKINAFKRGAQAAIEWMETRNG